MKTLLITGASGFLGGYLIEQLSYIQEYKVLALGTSKEKLQRSFNHIQNIDFFDLKDFENGKIPFKKIDTVIHLAFARMHKGESEIARGLNFTNDLFNQITNWKVPSLINISTQEVYGNTSSPKLNEDILPAPNTIYGFAKYVSELLANNVSLNGKTVIANLRLAGLLGKETDERMVSKFIDNAIKGMPIQIIGGRQVFSQLDVRDASSAIISLLSVRYLEWKCIYNLGYLRSYSIVEIAELVAEVARELTKQNIIININNSDSTINIELNSSRFYNDTNWKPQYDMKAIIESIFRFKLQRDTFEQI